MSFLKPKTPLTVAKGRVKCFKCRNVTMAKDGLWHKSDLELIFLCRACGTAFRAASTTPLKTTPVSSS